MTRQYKTRGESLGKLYTHTHTLHITRYSAAIPNRCGISVAGVRDYWEIIQLCFPSQKCFDWQYVIYHCLVTGRIIK